MYVGVSTVVYWETVVVVVLVATNEVAVGVNTSVVVEAHTSLTTMVFSRFFRGGGG